jgi:predicted transglutaminase-like protease
VYPNYKEVDVIKSKGFLLTSIDNKRTLIKNEEGIEILYVLANNEGLETKIIRYYLNTFDTLTADNKISDFGGQRISMWKIQDDSTKQAKVSFEGSKVDLELKMRNDKIYLESKFDLFHRPVKN